MHAVSSCAFCADVRLPWSSALQLKEMEEARRKFLGITAQSGPTREERMRARMVGRRWSEEPRVSESAYV